MFRACLVLTVVLGACASAGEGTGGDPPDAEVASPPDACVELAETCNGLDDDCDQNVDETFTDLGADCVVGEGECTAAGHMACDPGGLATICDATSGTPDGELCNGLDDDCDTMVDEGLGVGDPCDGTDGDACEEGAIVCANDSAVCDDATSDTPELCNGADDDCRLGIDDPWPVGQACTTGVGACAASGQWACNSTSSVACDAIAGSPTSETCGDGIDQDCNGGDVTCPTNDLASGAIDISAGGLFSVDLVAAHDNHTVGTCGFPAGGGRDVYYRFTLPAAEVVYFDTFGSSFDTVLRLYTGSCTAIASEVACADDQCDISLRKSQLATQLAAGTYCLIVDQFSSSQTSGNVQLQFTRGGRAGTAISAVNGTQNGTTAGQLNAQTSTTCQSNASGPEQNYWFTLCPLTSKTVAANTCTSTSWDSIVTLRSGAGLTGCSDDACGASGLQSSLGATSISGPNLYFLVVDGYNGASGSYSLAYTIQ